MSHELRIQVTIPLPGDAMARARAVAEFETAIDEFSTRATTAGGTTTVDVVKAKPRPAKPDAAAPEGV